MKKFHMYQALFALGISMTLLASVNAEARGSHGRHGPQDADGDGVISQAEVLTHAKERFDRKDTNGDGSISWEEVETSAMERFQRKDRNGDGSLSPDEMRPGRRGGQGGPSNGPEA